MAVDAGNGVKICLYLEQLFEGLTFTHVLRLSGNSQYCTTIRQIFHKSLPP